MVSKRFNAFSWISRGWKDSMGLQDFLRKVDGDLRGVSKSIKTFQSASGGFSEAPGDFRRIREKFTAVSGEFPIGPGTCR